MVNLGVLIASIIGLITTLVTGWVSWFFTRKKYNSEVANNLIINMQNSLEFYKRLSDDNKTRLEEVLKRNDRLEEKNDALAKEISDLKTQVFNLMSSICTDLTCQLRKVEPIIKKEVNEVNTKQEIQTQ